MESDPAHAVSCVRHPGETVQGKYISQTNWESREDFENWTKSGQFASSHGGGSSSSSGTTDSAVKRPSNTMAMLEGPPTPELFSTVTVTEW